MTKRFPENEKLVNHITYNKDPKKRAIARQPEEATGRFIFFKNLLSRAWDYLWPNPRNLIGFTNKEALVKESGDTSNIIGGANLVNLLTMIPVIYLAFIGIGVLGFGTIVILTVLLQIINTGVTNAAGAGKPGKRAWSNTMLVILLLLNTLYSTVSGIGTLVITGRSDIANKQAQNLVKQLEKNAKDAESMLLQNEQHQALKRDCSDGQKQIRAERDRINEGIVDRQSSDLDRLLLKYEGSYKDSTNPNKDWSTEKNIPICQRVKLQEAEASDKARAIQDEIIEAQSKGLPPLGVIKQKFPDLYMEQFDENGSIKSPNAAVKVAWEFFWEQIAEGQWSELGMPIILFSLSWLTSLGGILALALFMFRKDVIETKDPNLERNIRCYFENLLQEEGIEIDDEQPEN